MRRAPVVIYDLNLRRVAFLENAYNVGYDLRFNQLWTAHFSLPLDDPKNAYCQPFYFVEIFDGRDRVDLFRIMPVEVTKSPDSREATYQCEHVLATLIDDVLFRYHQIGGLGVYTSNVLQYILSYQATQRWTLGQVDFTRQFEYKFENENLLAAIFSVPKPFDEEYQWTWDTSVYPWKLSLIRPPTTASAYIRYRKNLKGVTKRTDPTDLCTRLYALGYGEGVNQLGIERANPTGKPYIDADTQTQFGIITRVWVDRRYESEESLYNAAKALLEKLKLPRMSYTIEAADLYQVTRDPIDLFQIGTIVRVVDDELNLTFDARVVRREKGDVVGRPSDVTLEISNSTLSLGDSIANLADRTHVNEAYSQGATNLTSYSFTDNCDPNYPAVIKFYIPEETVRINKALLNYEVSQFRAYSKATKGGGAVQTTTAAGGYTSSSTSSGGYTASSTESGGGVYQTIPYGDRGSVNFDWLLDSWQSFIYWSGPHNHGIPDGTALATAEGGSVTFVESGDHIHRLYDFSVYVDIPAHSHNFTVPNHTHNFTVPDHTHQLTLADHTHDIEYGIYLGPSPTAITLKVDGNVVANAGVNASDLDLIPYLTKDTEGKVQRGWHTIEITPNDLGRVVANVILQVFVQSRGGGDY